jgi:hypothetical protein
MESFFFIILNMFKIISNLFDLYLFLLDIAFIPYHLISKLNLEYFLGKFTWKDIHPRYYKNGLLQKQIRLKLKKLI